MITLKINWILTDEMILRTIQYLMRNNKRVSKNCVLKEIKERLRIDGVYFSNSLEFYDDLNKDTEIDDIVALKYCAKLFGDEYDFNRIAKWELNE